jgi:hypothetical protein
VTSITDNFTVARSSFDRFLSVPKKISPHAPGEHAFALDAVALEPRENVHPPSGVDNVCRREVEASVAPRKTGTPRK